MPSEDHKTLAKRRPPAAPGKGTLPFRRHRAGALLLALAMFLFQGIAAAQDALTVSDRRLFADGLFSRGLHARAAAEYEALATEFPTMEELDVVLFRWAEALRLASKTDEASRVLLRIIRERPQSPFRLRAMFQRGALAISQDHYEAAAELLGALLEENPPPDIREPALYYRAEALAQLGAAKDAIPLYELLLKDYPDGTMAAYARLSLGRQLLAADPAGGAERARTLFRASAEKPPTPRLGAEALYLLAQCDFAQGRFKESADTYLELARRYPADERTAASGLQTAWASHNAGLYAESLGLATKASVDPATPRRDEWLYLKGNAEFHLTRYREAVESYAALTRDHPDSRFAGAAWYQTAVSQQRLGDFAAAAAAALRVPATDPLRRDVLWLLGECYAELKDADRAVQYYRLLTEEFPKGERAPEALYRLAHQLQSREAWVDASTGYLQLVERFGEHELAPRALFASGFCLMKADQSAKAVRDWDLLIQKYPKDETAHEALFRKALEEIRLARHDDALASLDTLLRGPAEAAHVREARFWRATLLHRKADLPEAEKSLRAVLADQPPKDLEREASFLLGLVLQQAGRDADAAALFQKLIDDPLRTRFTPHQLAWLSEHQAARGAFVEAEAAARRLAEQAPDDAWKQAAWTLAGRAARGRKDAKAAETAFRAAVAVPGETRYSAEAHLRLGELRLEATDATQAETHFRTAAKLAATPDLQGIRILAQAGLGRALRQRGDRDAAARYLLGVCLLYKDDTLLPPLLAETIPLLRELGRTDEADALLKDLRELYPKSPEAATFAAAKEAAP